MRLGVIMDPISQIHYHKDSTLAMLWEAKRRGFELFYMTQSDLALYQNTVVATAKPLDVFQDPARWFTLGPECRLSLAQMDVILMRKDPPFDMEYVFTTHLLDLAKAAGALVINNPQSLRDANEKLFIAWFPEWIPSTLVARNLIQLKEFVTMQHDVILKPLDGMGGKNVFRVQIQDPNINVILETLTNDGTRYIMAQKYIPEVLHGDKRILLIDGEPIPYALARIPKAGETRANLAAGGHGKVVPLSARDKAICAQVGPILRARGLLFVGLDVIGDYLTEINVTSPTCIQEIAADTGLNICEQLFDAILKRIQKDPK